MMIKTQRPGVFSSYTVASAYPGTVAKGVGLVCTHDTEGQAAGTEINSSAQLEQQFGPAEKSLLAAAGQVLFENGASNVYCAAIPATISSENRAAAYAAAFESLRKFDGIYAVVCDSDDPDVLAALKAHVIACSEASHERLAFAGPASGDTDMIGLAGTLLHERVCICSPMAIAYGQTHGIFLAAALAAMCACAQDPSASLNGEQAKGLTGLSRALSEEEVDASITGGVCPFENSYGGISLIRAVTTRTKTGGVPDRTFQSTNVIMCIDDCLKGVRDALRLRLKGAKNNEATRGAIRSQVAVELRKKQDAGIIEGFAVPNVAASLEDPSVCVVELMFQVCQAVNQIHIVASIQV